MTHEYGTVLNGFAAEIAPQTFTLLTQSATDDGPIAYIGLCIPLVFVGLGCQTDKPLRPLQNPMACSPPNRKDVLLTSHIERALCKVLFIVNVPRPTIFKKPMTNQAEARKARSMTRPITNCYQLPQLPTREEWLCFDSLQALLESRNVRQR